MMRNGQRKTALLSALIFASAVLLSSVVVSAQTAATHDDSGAIEVLTGDGPSGIASDGTNVWVTNQFGNSVVKIAPAAR